MGLELLDIQFRIEKTFGFKKIGESYNAFFEARGQQVTVRDLHDFICEQLTSEGKSTYGSWQRLKIILVNALGVKPDEIRRDVRLIIDLGAA